MVRIAGACAAGALVVGMLSGCGVTTDAEAVTPPADSAADAQEDASPETTTTSASGIEFINVPASMRGTDADVYSAIAVYERQLWRATTDGDLGLSIYEPGGAIPADDVEPEQGGGLAVVGTLLVSISGIAVDGDTATGQVCRDFSELSLDGSDARISAAEAGFDARRAVTMTLRLMNDDVWRIENTQHTGAC